MMCFAWLVVPRMCQWSFRFSLLSCFLPFIQCSSSSCLELLHWLVYCAFILCTQVHVLLFHYTTQNWCFKVIQHGMKMTADGVDYSGASLLSSCKKCICWVHDKWRFLRSCCPFSCPPSIPFIFMSLFIPCLSRCPIVWKIQGNVSIMDHSR